MASGRACWAPGFDSFRRTRIQLPEVEYDLPGEVVSREHRSVADCIREASRLLPSTSRRSADNVDEISGRFCPRPLAGLKPHDRWLVEAIDDSKSRAREP